MCALYLKRQLKTRARGEKEEGKQATSKLIDLFIDCYSLLKLLITPRASLLIVALECNFSFTLHFFISGLHLILITSRKRGVKWAITGNNYI
jgi:hypothetical protein